MLISNNIRKNGFKKFFWLLTINILLTNAEKQQQLHQEKLQLEGLYLSNNENVNNRHRSSSGNGFTIEEIQGKSAEIKTFPDKVFNIYHESVPKDNILNANANFNINNNNSNNNSNNNNNNKSTNINDNYNNYSGKKSNPKQSQNNSSQTNVNTNTKINYEKLSINSNIGNSPIGQKFSLTYGKEDSNKKHANDDKVNKSTKNNKGNPTTSIKSSSSNSNLYSLDKGNKKTPKTSTNGVEPNNSDYYDHKKVKLEGKNDKNSNEKVDNALKTEPLSHQPDININNYDYDNNENKDYESFSSTTKNKSREHFSFKVDHENFEKTIVEDVKTMQKNEEEYIEVQFVRPNNNGENNQLKPVYVKKKFLSGKDGSSNTSTPLNKRGENSNKSKIQKRREMIREQSIKKLGKLNSIAKRELHLDSKERSLNSRTIKTKLLTFDYFCDYDISENLCNKVEETLKKCSQYIQKMISIKNTLHITVDFYSFCTSKNCVKKTATVASSSPSCLYLLNDANGVEWSFPRALYKQLINMDVMELDDEDIYVQINNNYEYYFGVSSNKQCILYISFLVQNNKLICI